MSIYSLASKLKTDVDFINHLDQAINKSVRKSVKVWCDYPKTGGGRAGSYKSLHNLDFLIGRDVEFRLIDEGTISLSFNDEIVLWSHKNLDRCICGNNKFRIDYLCEVV